MHRDTAYVSGGGEVLREGMVLMVEPGAYDPEVGGVRTEWMVEVTRAGCRPVSPFRWCPSIGLP